MIEFSDKSSNLTKALLAVQKAVSTVKRDATNPHFRSRYATLENVVAALRGPCTENGIVITQAAGEPVENMIPVETRIMHESGEWMKSTLSLPVTKFDAQGVGSAITYGCRYSLMSLFCLPPADDDGNVASEGKPVPQKSHTAGGITQMHPRTVVDGRQKSSSQAKKDKDHEIIRSMEECESAASLDAWMRANRDLLELLPANWQNEIHERWDEARAAFVKSEAADTKSPAHKQLEESVNMIGAG